MTNNITETVRLYQDLIEYTENSQDSEGVYNKFDTLLSQLVDAYTLDINSITDEMLKTVWKQTDPYMIQMKDETTTIFPKITEEILNDLPIGVVPVYVARLACLCRPKLARYGTKDNGVSRFAKIYKHVLTNLLKVTLI